MAQIRQKLILAATGGASSSNVVVLNALTDQVGLPNHLSISCAVLYTTAATAPSEFWPGTGTGSTPVACTFYEMTINLLTS